MPVIPVLWGVKVGGSLEPRSSRPAWATWKKPTSAKNTTVSMVVCSSQILRRLRHENRLSLGNRARLKKERKKA